MRISLKHRLIIALAGILTTAFVLISGLNYTAATKALTLEISGSSLPLLRENIYSELQRDFLPAMHIASMMAADSFLKNWALDGERDRREIVQYLKEIRDKYGYESTFFVSAATGRYYHFDGVLKELSPQDEHDRWFYSFRDSGRLYRLDVDTDQAAEDRLTIFVNYRLEDYEGRFLGVVGVGIVMQNFSALLRAKESDYRRRIYLVDRTGLVQAATDAARIHRDSLADIPETAKLFARNADPTEKPFDSTYEGPNGTVMVTARYMPEIDWFLAVETDRRDVLRSSRNSLATTILIGLSASILVILLSLATFSRFHTRLEELASTDDLTGCANRREFEARMKRMFYRRERYGRPLSLAMIDVDFFKRVNDALGHHAGDRLLKGLADTMLATKRPDDVSARLGGDEFAVALEADAAEAAAVAERIAASFRTFLKATAPNVPGLGLSIGIAQAADGDDIEKLLAKADSALYAAKREGRGRIVRFSGTAT